MAIEIKDAGFAYPNGYRALENITLTIQEGEKVAIVGQNGAGKTTCVKMMNGLHKPTDGVVLVDGIDTKSVTTATVARIVGYVFQNPDEQIFNSTARKEIEYMPRYMKLDEDEIKKRVDHAVALTDIEKYLDMNPYEIPYPIRKFVSIAAVIASDPKYIILDEPTAGQDYHGSRVLSSMIAKLHEEGKTVITITHDMEFALNNFDRVVAMAHKNVIADGTAADIFWNEDVVRDSRIRMPIMGQLAKALGLEGRILTCEELVKAL
ncbi:MAG: ABC transporter ATP-binding protein [Lachnospiraceae bacterium]|nr:ABC transporter ATP-binding protein [Lachnospiraceae bacterium]